MHGLGVFVNILIPMAGEGARFKQEGKKIIKPLIDVLGKPMAVRAIETLGLDGNFIFVVQNNEVGMEILDTISMYYKKFKAFFVDGLTEGPACSALAAKEAIDNEEKLIITNCDQVLTWDSNAFSVFINSIDYEGLIVTYFCDTNKNSYAKVDSKGLVSVIKEKEIISDISLNGVHYWKKGKDFVSSAEEMINKKDKSINGEYYIGPTYNYMIKKKKRVGIYHIPNSQHHAIGVPEDLERYLKNADLQS